MIPGPVPDEPEVRLTKPAPGVAVQEQPLGAPTAIDPVPPAAGKLAVAVDWPVTVSEDTQGAPVLKAKLMTFASVNPFSCSGTMVKLEIGLVETNPIKVVLGAA